MIEPTDPRTIRDDYGYTPYMLARNMRREEVGLKLINSWTMSNNVENMLILLVASLGYSIGGPSRKFTFH